MSEVENSPAPQEIGTADPAPDEIVEDSSPSQVDAPEAASESTLKGPAKRIHELTAQRYAEQRAREDAQRDRDYWRELAMKNQTAPPTPQQGDKEPELGDFTDFSDFNRAQARYEARQEIKAAMQAERDAQEQQRAQYEAMTLRETFEAKARQFETDAPDWRQVVSTMPLSDATFQAAQQSEMGPALLYHLGKNPQLAAQIYSMTPYQQAMQLGRLEAQLSAPQAKRVSGAPEPITPLSGGGSAAYDPNRGTAEDYKAWRNAQLYGNKK